MSPTLLLSPPLKQSVSDTSEEVRSSLFPNTPECVSSSVVGACSFSITLGTPMIPSWNKSCLCHIWWTDKSTLSQSHSCFLICRWSRLLLRGMWRTEHSIVLLILALIVFPSGGSSGPSWSPPGGGFLPSPSPVRVVGFCPHRHAQDELRTFNIPSWLNPFPSVLKTHTLFLSCLIAAKANVGKGKFRARRLDMFGWTHLTTWQVDPCKKKLENH